MWRIILIVIALLLSACTSKVLQQNQQIAIAKAVQFNLLTPQSFGHNLSLTQVATIEYQDRQETLLFHTIIDHQKIVLFGLTANGIRLFTITYADNKIQTDGFSQVVEAIKPEYLLADLQLALWPIDKLQQNFGNSLLIDEDSNYRTFSKNNNSIIKIQYWSDKSLEDNKQSSVPINFITAIEFHHVERNYKLNLLTEEVKLQPFTEKVIEESHD